MKLRVITPEKVVLAQKDVTFLSVTTPGGSLGILPQHAPLFTDIAENAPLAYDSGGVRRTIQVSGGVMHVLSDTITIMTQAANSNNP